MRYSLPTVADVQGPHGLRHYLSKEYKYNIEEEVKKEMSTPILFLKTQKTLPLIVPLPRFVPMFLWAGM